MPFTAEEKVRVRLHLGYPLQGEVQSYFASIPFSRQTLYLLEATMARVAEESLATIRETIGYCDKIRKQIFCAAFQHMAATKLEDLTPNPTYNADLRREYFFWQCQLSQQLGTPLNMDFSGVRTVDAGIRQVKLG